MLVRRLVRERAKMGNIHPKFRMGHCCYIRKSGEVKCFFKPVSPGCGMRRRIIVGIDIAGTLAHATRAIIPSTVLLFEFGHARLEPSELGNFHLRTARGSQPGAQTDRRAPQGAESCAI